MTYEYNPHTLGTYTLAWYNDHDSVTETSDDINTKDEDDEIKDTDRELMDILNSLHSEKDSQKKVDGSKTCMILPSSFD